MNDQNLLLNLTNTSGFVFQIGVRHEIERTSENHGWTILAEEHHWRHPENGQSGFIDLVASHNPEVAFRMVIECKRATDQKWIFLVPISNLQPVTRTSIFWADRDLVDQGGWAWDTDNTEPNSIESSFCVVKGQADKNTPMLERITDILLPSVEAVALEEMSLVPHSPIRAHGFYLPVIVTNAKLYSCVFDPAHVSMDSGRLSNGEIKEEKMVRFRKGLITGFKEEMKARDLTDANEQKQRSIWVVNSSYLAEILASFKPSPIHMQDLAERIRSGRPRDSGAMEKPES